MSTNTKCVVCTAISILTLIIESMFIVYYYDFCKIFGSSIELTAGIVGSTNIFINIGVLLYLDILKRHEQELDLTERIDEDVDCDNCDIDHNVSAPQVK